MKEKTIDYILRNTWQTVAKMYAEEANKYGETMAVGFTLLCIDREGGTPSTALGPRMGMEATSLSRTLKYMEENGLIVRKPNPNDGRSVLVFLTKLGLEKRELSKSTVLKFNETITNNIPEEKIKHFTEVAEMVTEMIVEKRVFS